MRKMITSYSLDNVGSGMAVNSTGRSSVSAFPEIVAAAGNQIGVHFEGEIGSGQDVLKALCLGAYITGA